MLASEPGGPGVGVQGLVQGGWGPGWGSKCLGSIFQIFFVVVVVVGDIKRRTLVFFFLMVQKKYTNA